MIEKKKRKPWVRPRHKVISVLARPIVALIAALKYHAKIDRFSQEDGRNWLVLSNHQTDFDQFFISLAFHRPVYYVALEDLFSNGLISRLLEWAVAPIPILKGSADAKAVMTCFRVAREGGNVGLFPEGNRTYSGKTCYIKPSVAALAKKLGLPIAIFRIEGGYGIKPRWADNCRKGRMTAGVRRIIEPEEYKDLSKEELYDLICRELAVDESQSDADYASKRAAEHLERVLYVCPECGLSEFESAGDTVSCRRCRRPYRYRPNLKFLPPDGAKPFRAVTDWYDYQESFIRQLDLSPYTAVPLYTDTADVLEVIVLHHRQPLLKNAQIRLFADRLELNGGSEQMTLAYDDISAMTCVVGHKLNIFCGSHIYQFKGDPHFNALKYCNIYYHAKFTKETHEDGEFQFLGL